MKPCPDLDDGIAAAGGEPFSVGVDHEGDRLVVRPRGELDLATVGQLERAIRDAFASSAALTLDLRGLTFIDSTGVSLVLRAVERSGRDPQALALVPGSRLVMRTFSLLELDDLLAPHLAAGRDGGSPGG